MISRSPIDVLQRLVDALPRCCACEKDIAVVMNSERWWMCERCFNQVPCSDKPPVHDLRGPVYQAIIALSQSTSS